MENDLPCQRIKGVFHRNFKTITIDLCLLFKKEGFEERGMFIHRIFCRHEVFSSSACKDETASGRFMWRRATQVLLSLENSFG